MKAEIIAVGTELLLGDIVNTNAQYLSRKLADLGIETYRQTVVGDNTERLKDALFSAFSYADLVITTGGLGPTQDDLTKNVAAEYFGCEMVLDEESLLRIKDLFKKLCREMTENNLRQAYVPKGAITMHNDEGTAPGVIFEDKGKIIMLFPGPPYEMQPMFEKYALPFLKKRQEVILFSRVLRISKLGESLVETKIRDLIDKQDNPTIAPYFKGSEVILRVTAKAKDEKEAKELIKPVADEIYARLGENIYAEGETDIFEVTAKMLLEKKITVAAAESCTGGLLSDAFVKFPGISEVFIEGAVTYSNDAKMRRLGVKAETLQQFGAVSAEVAAEMAEGIAKTSGVDIGLSTTGVAGPDGGTEEKPVGLVYIGLFVDGKVKTKRLQIYGSRNRVRQRTVASVFDWLRKELSLR